MWPSSVITITVSILYEFHKHQAGVKDFFNKLAVGGRNKVNAGLSKIGLGGLAPHIDPNTKEAFPFGGAPDWVTLAAAA